MPETFDLIDKASLPNHIAVIMDGNGRWARAKGLPRTKGHEQGVKSVENAMEACGKLGIKYLTLYAFSTENWSRPKIEVKTLMRLLVMNLKNEIKQFHERKISLNVIGNIDLLPKRVKKHLLEVVEETKIYDENVLTLALSYGSREEIIKAVKEISSKVKNNIISAESIDEVLINKHLYTQNLPEVDLLIRTSGEQRISNFLLWQIAYAELYFTDILWPDFDKENLYEAVLDYQQRERRFGKTSEQLK
jgi:undecaprenyl diphosphate synthase